MTELEKIKILFQASVNNEQVIITLQDNTQLTGAIQSFDGSTVSVDGNSVGIDSIMSISLSSKYENQGDSETNKLEEYVKYKGKNIKVSYKDRDLIVTITAYVFDVVQKTVVLLTSSQKLLVDISAISDISVIYDDETTDKPEQDNPIPTELNAFEKAILDADQSTVTHYLENPESLKALGYTDTEINYALYQIKTPLPWNDVDAAKKPYNQARRIFTYERNRNQLAKDLFNEYISSSYVVPKYKVKAISSLIEILEVDSSEELVAFCEKNADYITRNSELCLKAALALLKNNQLDEVEKLVEHLPKDIDSSELMLVLNFYKEHPNYDFSKLPGLDALSRDVSFKELLWIKGLPSKQSFIQLLFLYEKYNRFDKFFGLLNLFMPEARNDQKTVELVRKCLEKTDDISNLLKYLPEFPLLWLDKDLVASFVNSFPAEKELSQKEQHLMNHAKRVEKYRTPNRLEESVIKANPQIFEVLRSNEGILKEMDYSADEILSIKEVDIDGIRFGKKPIAEKIYEFQGNKNYTAEMVSGREFLYYPERISRIIFPLLIEEKCGDLVYELYNYSPYIRTQLYHEKRYYINALLILNEKDIFWNETRDSWMTLKADDPALEELFKIALEKNEHAIADAVKLYSKKTPFNELENALITGNVSSYRTIATDAVLLSSLGYSTEEIQLVQSLLKQRVDFTAHDNLSIANRIYLAQKNKNQSAELFYQLAVKDSPVLASSGLFSIYENEGRYQDLCNVYENYYSCLPGHNPKEHGEQYLYSLYHTAQYQKLYEYWRENPDLKPDRLIIINSMMQLLLPDEQLDVLFREPIDVNEGNNNLAKECIIFLLSRTESPIIWDFLTRVYNLTFPYITAEEFADIKARFKFVGNKELACSGGLIALTEASDKETILSEWYKYLMQLFSDAAVKISITENIIEYYMCNGNSLKDSIQTTVLQLQESGVDIPQKIMQYIYSHIESDHDKILWLDEHLRQSSDISSPTFKIYLRFAQDLNSRQHVVDLLDKLSKRDISFVEDYIQACFYYLDEEDQNKNIAMILRCILQFSKDRVFTSAELEALYTAYTKLGNTSFAFFAQYALHNTFSTLSTDIRSEIENETQTIMGEQSLYTATKEVLSSESINDIDAVITLWGRYFKISDDDTANITILKDYYNEPSKWTKESIDSLIIHLIVFPSVPLYWRLLRLHFAEESDTIKCCIDYHLAIAEKASLLPILTEAINNGFETQSIAIATRILSSMDMSNIQNSVLAIRSLTNNKFEWIQKHNTTLIDGICHNRKIYSDIKTESIAVETAMEIAFDGNNEEYFYNAFQAELNSNMLGINLKFLCNLILHSPEKMDLIAFSKTTILNGGEQLPYFNVISDLLLREVSSFTNEDKGILELISSNRENAVDELNIKRYYIESIARGNEELGYSVISRVKPYYPDLPVFDDVDKYHMMFDEVLDDEVYSTYVNDLEGLSLLASPSRTCKSIINLLPGELYLKSKGYAIESAYEYGSKNMTTQFIEEMERRWELLQGLEHALRVSGGKELADIILKCCYARKWNDFILYNTDDRLLNDIILNDPSLKTLLYKKSYEVLKSSVLCILPTEQDNTDIIDRVDAIMIATDGIKHSKNYLRRIQKMDEEEKDAVKKVFSLRIESKSLRESGIIGSTILKIPGNEKFAFLLGMLGSKNVSELFDNKMCWQTLLEMPTEKALAISQIYAEQFYEGIKNIFSKFIQLKTQGKDEFVLTETPFESEHDFCKQSREKYLKFQKSIAESTKPVTKLAIKNLTATYLEYLYDAVVNNSTTDISQINPSERDYLCVVTYLFNKRTVVEIRNYFSHLETVALVPCFGVVLTILNQFSSAYDAYSRIDENSWKTALGQIMFRYMNIATLTKEERDIRYAILNQNTQTNEYFIGKFIPVKPDQYPVYSEKMLALVSFADELIQLLSFNGVDVSWIHLDKERTKSSLPEPDSISIVDASSTQETPKAMPKESISELVENEYLSKILLSSSDIHPESYSGENPPTIRECIGEIKFIIETKKDSQNKLDYLRAKHLCRWIYLKSMDEDGFSRDLLLKILQLVTEEDSISKPQWDSIYSRIIEYFENITSLQQLSRYAEHDLPFLKNVSIIANAKVKLLSITDKKIWSNIISTISQVAGFSETQASEADQLHKLLGIRSKLNVYSSSNSLFSIINTKLTLLLSNQITLFRHSPEISIEIVDEKEGFSQSIVWEDSNDIGTMYAIISNVGGDDALDVKLISSINMSREKTFSIKKIYSGEKIPFKETFFINDIRNGKVTWDITITYFDVEKSKTVTCMHETTANINMGGTPLNLGYINTGNPADSNNFVGRSRELAILKNHYSQIQQLPSMLIRGLKRSGKSSLLAKFYEKIRSGDKIITCIIDAQSIGRNLKSAFVDKVLDGIRFGYQRHPRYKTLFEEQFYTFKDAWIARLETDDWISQLDAFYFELSQFMHGKLLLIYDEMESIFYNHQFESVEQEESLYAALRALIQKRENYVSFIFCGSDVLLTSCLEQRRESQMFQTLQYLEVGHMNRADIRAIFDMQSKKYDAYFSPDAVDAIWEYTHGLVWYAKLIGFIILHNIMSNDLTVRKNINRVDVSTAVQMLINGEIGTDKYDLLDATLSTERSAILHALAEIMPDFNMEVSVEEILSSIKMLQIEGYTDRRNGEKIPDIDEMKLRKELEFLVKMQFITSNESKTKYSFVAELYRLFFRKEKKMHLFEERRD